MVLSKPLSNEKVFLYNLMLHDDYVSVIKIMVIGCRDIPVDMKYVAEPQMHSMPAVTAHPNGKCFYVPYSFSHAHILYLFYFTLPLKILIPLVFSGLMYWR